MSIVAGLTTQQQQQQQQQKTHQRQIKQLEAKIKSSGARNNRAGAKGDGPSRTYLSMVARFVLVDSSTHVGIGKIGQPHNDIFEKNWLAKQEGCAPAERCWLPLIARGGCVM